MRISVKISLAIMLISIVLASLYYYGFNNGTPENLSVMQLHDKIADLRQIAIAKAQATGDYKCCINPPCTMCFESANKWNYGQSGKCFCDEFIARGEDPCPQCQKGVDCSEKKIHGSESDAFCDVNQHKNSTE